MALFSLLFLHSTSYIVSDLAPGAIVPLFSYGCQRRESILLLFIRAKER